MSAAIFVTALALGAAIASAATCNVPADHATIQSAVDDLNCTTINVAAGTYAEGVSIGRAVTLAGPNSGVSALGTRGPEATVTSSGTTFNVTNASVTIDGFTVNGGFAVYVSGSSTGTLVENNIITGTSRALTLDAPGDNAGVLNNSLVSDVRSLHVSSGPYTNLKVNGNGFSGGASTGIFFSAASANTITGFESDNNHEHHLANM